MLAVAVTTYIAQLKVLRWEFISIIPQLRNCRLSLIMPKGATLRSVQL
jgi:hypothetical protein